MAKTTFLLGAAVGYVLGARAGRGRYEQIAAQASKWWGNPAVQDRVSTVQDAAVGTAKSAAGKATTAVKDKVSGGGDAPSTPSAPATSSTPPAPATPPSGVAPGTAPGTTQPTPTTRSTTGTRTPGKSTTGTTTPGNITPSTPRP